MSVRHKVWFMYLSPQRVADRNVSRMHSRAVVHLQWSLRPLPGFGFHGNTISSILRPVFALLLPRPSRNEKLWTISQFPIVLGQVVSFSSFLFSICFSVYLVLGGGLQKRLQVSVSELLSWCCGDCL